MAGKPDRRLSRKQRLTNSASFRETYAQNRRFVGHFVVMWLRQGDAAALRLGVVASRKVGSAVARNRAKRRLREVFRLNRHRLYSAVDVVLVARRSLLKAQWEELQNELLALAGQAGILRAAAGPDAHDPDLK